MWRRVAIPLGLAALAAAALAACGGDSQGTTEPAASGAAQTARTSTAPLPPATTTAPENAPFRAALKVSTRTPVAGASWPYRLEVTDPDGKPLHATITVQVVDPLQQPHPVEYGRTTKKLVDWPIDGTFADDVLWPASSRGFPLTFRVIVEAAGGSATLTVPVRVR